MLQIIKSFSSKSADLLGISASVLCMIHCMVFPVMVSMGYVFRQAEEIDHEHWHFLDYVFIALAVLAVVNAAKNTNSDGIKIALWIAVSIFSIGVMLHEYAPWMLVISVSASVALLIIHILNWKRHKKCNVIGK